MTRLLLLLLACDRDDACPTVYRDKDEDGFGDAAWVTCVGPSPGWVANGGDCDDDDPERHPGAPSRCDGVDYDCDGDPGVVLTWHRDKDGDGYGDPSPTHGCRPQGAVAFDATDCDDWDEDEHPGAVWFYDGDQDDYGVDGEGVAACERPSATWAPQAGDCDDTDASTRPGARERCDGEDDDCDGVVDDDPVDMTTWYADADGDGWGGDAVEACERPADVVDTDGDCDDADATTWPGAPEPDCDDPVDHNCDGSAGLADGDGDGAAACLDCDDRDASRGATLPETCDGQDDDCDGEIDEDDAVDADAWFTDEDWDGYGTGEPAYACRGGPRLASQAGDCDDTDPDSHPAAYDACADGVDQDCDGAIDEGCR